MLATRFRATVDQKQSRKQGDHQQPWSSERRAQGVDHTGTRKMVIPTTASKIISVKRAAASLRLTLLTGALYTSSACGSHSCCVRVSLRGICGAVGVSLTWLLHFKLFNLLLKETQMSNSVVNYDGSITASPTTTGLPGNGRRHPGRVARPSTLSEPRSCDGELPLPDPVRVFRRHHAQHVAHEPHHSDRRGQQDFHAPRPACSSSTPRKRSATRICNS